MFHNLQLTDPVDLKTAAGESALHGSYPSEAAGTRVAGPQGPFSMGGFLGVAFGGLVAAGLSFGAVPARAQTPGVNFQCSTTSASGATVTGQCPVSSAFPLPVTSGTQSLLAVATSQVGTVISSATLLTIPTGATTAVVQAQGTNNGTGVCLFWRDDGTDPSATAGQALSANASITIRASTTFKAFAATGATCTMSVAYYK